MTAPLDCRPPEWQDETPPEVWGDECASCPFCGSVEIRPWTDDKTGNHMMWCYTCGADGPPADNDADAEERWNRRVTPPATVAALVEALKKTERQLVTWYRLGSPAGNVGSENAFADADPIVKEARTALAAYLEGGQ